MDVYLVVVSNIFYFHPYLGNIPILTTVIFFKWVGSTTNQYLYSAYNTPLITKKPIISVWHLGLDGTPGRTLLLPMARLPSSTVAQTLVKGLQVASQQGAIREVFFYYGWFNLPSPSPPKEPPVQF